MEIVFKPWVGDKYDNGGLSGLRILAVGESHYVGAAGVTDPELTRKVISRYCDPNDEGLKRGFFTVVARALLRERWAAYSARCEALQKVVFYNFLQHGLEAPRQRVDERWRDHIPAFETVVHDYRPDGVIFFSKRMWKTVGCDLEQRFAKKGPRMCGVHHPAGGFRYATHLPRLEAFFAELGGS